MNKLPPPKKTSAIIKNQSMLEFVDTFTSHMARETVKLLTAQGNKVGPVMLKTLNEGYVTRCIALMVHDVLNHRPAEITSTEDLLDYNQKAFLEIKTGMQDAVALAFQSAMNHYSGKQLEYYCQIKVVPEPINKKVC